MNMNTESEDARTAALPGCAAGPTVRELIPKFLDYCRYQWCFRPNTLKNYRCYAARFATVIGNMQPGEIGQADILAIKERLRSRTASPATAKLVLFALRSFLRFCHEAPGIETMPPSQIRCPRPPRREVAFLLPDEVEQFVAAIPVEGPDGRLSMQWLGFRALVEVLLGTGLRLSEALSLRRSIDFQTREAMIVGKGGKQRKVFFTRRSLQWLKEYFGRRKDSGNSAFVIGASATPLSVHTAEDYFQIVCHHSGLQKRVTAHILRHTVATTLLFNNCSIAHVKEILGHELLETTCKYYLGVDKRSAHLAFQKYLRFDDRVDSRV